MVNSIARRVFTRGLSAPLARLLIGLAFVIASAPMLYDVFGESVDPVGLRHVGISTDCRKSFFVKAGLVVTAEGDANVHLKIGPDDPEAIGTSCKKLQVWLPGVISSATALLEEPQWGEKVYGLAKPSEPAPASAASSADHFNNAGVDFVLIDLVAVRKRLDRYPHWEGATFAVQATIPRLLFSRTYSTKMLNLTVQHEPGAVAHVTTDEEKGAPSELPAPWRIDAAMALDKLFQISSDGTKYAPRYRSDGIDLTIPTNSDGDAEITMMLENTERARTRDVRNVFAGAIMAAGIAILVDFGVDLVGLIAERGRTPPEAGAELVRAANVERARRRVAWRAAKLRRSTGATKR